MGGANGPRRLVQFVGVTTTAMRVIYEKKVPRACTADCATINLWAFLVCRNVGAFLVCRNVGTFEVPRLKRNFVARETAISQKMPKAYDSVGSKCSSHSRCADLRLSIACEKEASVRVPARDKLRALKVEPSTTTSTIGSHKLDQPAL